MVVGAGAGEQIELSLSALIRKRALLRGTVLRVRPLEEKGAAVRAFEREVLSLLAVGRVRPLIDSVFPAAEITAAFDHLMAHGKLGKVLIEF